MEDGKTTEAGVLGKEGFTGIAAAVGLGRTPHQAVMQITGDGFRIEAAALQTTLESSPHLQLLLTRYAVVQGMQVAQTAACNRLHDIGQRLARWLLMAQDRVGSDACPLLMIFCNDARNQLIQRDFGGWYFAAKEGHRVCPWRSDDCEPQGT